jgi:hypothetical protein
MSSARAKLEEVELALRQPTALTMESSDVEALIDKEGREIQRRLLQDHLDLRREREARGRSIEGSDGVVRGQHRERGRNLISLFGDVRVTREGIGSPGVSSVFPMDGELNLPDHSFSPGVERRVGETASQVSFENAVETMATTTGAPVAKRQAEELAVEAARDFEGFYEARKAKGAEPAPILVVTFDGKGLRMIKRDLREATRKAADERHPKLGTRVTKGEKTGTKRMAEVAAVYTIEPFVRTPEDVVKDLRPVRDVGVKRPKPQNKRVWASVEREMADVVEEAFQEALVRDPRREKTWVALLDGNPHQLRLVKAAAQRHHVALDIVVDIIHVLEYLWDAAHAFHPEASAESEEWVTERFTRVLRGEASLVAGGMRRSATLQEMKAEARRPVDDAANYLINLGPHLHYDLHLASGFPIATGVIEGACRHLIKDRMEITGATWGLERAEAILKLRSLKSSGDFEEYWAFHLKQQLTRCHLSQYADGKLPEAQARLRVVK